MLLGRSVGSAAVVLALLECWAQGGKAGPEGDEEPTVVAILPFRNSTGEAKYAPLVDGVPELLTALLSKSDRLKFVERSALDKVLKEQALSVTGLVDGKTKAKVGRLVGAKYILTGGIAVAGGTLRINAHFFEVKSTRIAKSGEAEGQAGDVLQIVQELASKLARGIDVKLPRITEEEIDRSPEANLHYMRGLGYYYGNLPDHAIAEFMKALAIEPRHAKARYWNARCYFDGKEWEHAAIEYERFLQDFPEHELSAAVKKELKSCRSSKPED